ncbi:VOC family protein [Streptomyces mirabilis]|uniref:hypothetical protein n=1 Tax=Streptomyces mirabilis TaxID=68239 RepID=UPI00368CC108
MLGVSDVPRAAAFWMKALGYVPRKDMEGDWAVLVPAEGVEVSRHSTTGHAPIPRG